MATRRTNGKGKAAAAASAHTLEQIPNVGPSIAGDFRRLGLARPADLIGADPLVLYRRLQELTGSRQDPCVLDVFMAAVRFMEGAPPQPWWSYTPERKKLLANQ